MLTQDQVRKMGTIHKTFSDALEKHYTILNSHVTDVDIAFTDQTTYAEYIEWLSNPTHAYTFTLNVSDGPAVLNFQLPIRNEFLKFSGAPKADGPLTDEERRVMTLFARLSLADLEDAWRPVEHIEVSDATIKTDPNGLRVAEPDDVVLLVGLECHMQHANGSISVCYPFKTIESLMPKLDAWQA